MAKVCDISFLCPVLEYLVGVDYSTPRELTICERLVLEAINICKGTEFDALAISQLFESVILLPESEKLIRPVISALKNDGLLEIKIWNDALTLGDIFVKDIQLTDRGNNILRKGAYPSNARRKNMSLYYNPYQNLISEYINLSDDASGFKIMNDEEFTKVDFPMNQIAQYLSRIANNNNKEVRPILPFGSEIDEISPLKEPVVKSYVIKRQLHIKDNFELYIVNDFLPDDLAVKAIEYYLNKDKETKYGKGKICPVDSSYPFEAFFKIQALASLSDKEIQKFRIATFPLKFKGHIINAPMAYSLKPAYANKQEQLLRAA